MANTLEGEWQDLALDQGDEILQQNEYYATLDDGNSPISTRVTGISYSPSINKVKNLNIDVPPSDSLEDDTYLGETLQVYVDSSLLFEGKIVNIATSQVTGEDYSVEAEPPAKKLKGNSVDRDFVNKLYTDALVNIVDESAEVSMAMRGVRELVNQDYEDKTIVGAEEHLTGVAHVGGNALKAQTSNAQVRHNYNGSISSMERLVVKAYTPSSASISLTVRGDNSTVDGESSFDAHNFTLSGLNKNKYGEWTEFTIDTNTDSFAYDLIFDMDEDCILFDWVMIRDDNEFSRNITTPSLTQNTSEKTVTVDVDGTVSPTQQNALDSVGSMYILDEDEGTVRPRQVTVWNRLRHSRDGQFDELYPKDENGRLRVDGDNRTSLILSTPRVSDGFFYLRPGTFTPDLSSEDAKEIWDGDNLESLVYDDMENIEVHVRAQILGDNNKSNPFEKFQINWDGDIYEYSKNSQKEISTQEPTWVTFQTEKSFNVSEIEEENDNKTAPFHVTELIDGFTMSNISSESGIVVDTSGDASNVDSGSTFLIDAIVFSHSPTVDDSLNLSFDREKFSYSPQKPKIFASPEHYDTEYFRKNSSFIKETSIEYVVPFTNNINKVENLNTDIDSSTNGIAMGQYSPGVRSSNDDRTGQGFLEYEFYSSTREFEVPGKNLRFQFRPSTQGSTSTFTPSLGYDREVHSSEFEFTVKFNDANSITSTSVQDNRLGAMNKFATDSGAYFRWDNTVCEIFERGDRTSSVTLYNEKIESSMDITETYNSCIVKGKFGVKSDEVVATNAPSFVEKKKFIRDRSIETVAEANAQARDFIENHSSIEYSGNIDTLPTLAPVGELMDGSLFNHGRDMIIKSVSYSKTSSGIKLGFTNNFASQMIDLEETQSYVDSDRVKPGIDVPTGKNNIRSEDRRGSDLQ